MTSPPKKEAALRHAAPRTLSDDTQIVAVLARERKLSGEVKP